MNKESRWSSLVNAMFEDANRTGEPVSFASVVEAQATTKLEQEHEARRKAKYGDGLQYDKNTPNNTPIDITTKSDMPSLETVRAAIKSLDGLSYSARSATGWRWEMDRARKPDDSNKLHKCYGSYKGKDMVLEYEVS